MAESDMETCYIINQDIEITQVLSIKIMQNCMYSYGSHRYMEIISDCLLTEKTNFHVFHKQVISKFRKFFYQRYCAK